MKLRCCVRGAAWAVTGACVISGVEAAEFERHDGVHRIEKKAAITQGAVLLFPRQDGESGSCATGMQLCPSSLDGGCCPDNYDCAKESCYATTRGPSTCGTRVGWYACDQVYGGGCCPDGYMCRTGGQCLPPSGEPYTFDCPASHYLCPSSLSYGCCPNGMGCAVNQCYSTEASTITTQITVTTTESGDARTYTTRTTTVQEPAIPTELPEVDAADDGEQRVLKYFPSSVPKVIEMVSSDGDEDGGGGGGLSTGQLAGIITGAVSFLVIVILAAIIIMRHLNKVAGLVRKSSSKQSGSSNNRPAMNQYKPTSSENDTLSIDPLMMYPPPANQKQGSTPGTGIPSAAETPSGSIAGGYESVHSAADGRHTSWDGSRHSGSYFDPIPGHDPRYSVQSTAAMSSQHRVSAESQGAYMHLRHWSVTSDEVSNHPDAAYSGPNNPFPELEARSIIPELPGSPTSSTTEAQRRRSSGGGPPMSPGAMVSRPPLGTHHQRMRSGTGTGTPIGHELTVVSEEIHGFHGPADKVVGQTDASGPSSPRP